jgi:hypothetical protein
VPLFEKIGYYFYQLPACSPLSSSFLVDFATIVAIIG